MSVHAVTGAFGYSGRYIAHRLLAQGKQVVTLTNSTHRENPFGEQVKAHPFNFDRPEKLVAVLRGVTVLYNTYWVRFNHSTFTFADAVRNSAILFDAARTAGVERIVHVSITNPSEDSPLEYFSGKARLERTLEETGVSHAVLRPTVLFGKEDILVNNIAWALRTFPVFCVPGAGEYKLQPIYVDDLARLAVELGDQRANVTVDAIGPETFTYRELVKQIGSIIGVERPVLSMPPSVVYGIGWLLGKFVSDVMLTRAEIDGLMGNLLCVDSPPTGERALTDWANEHAAGLGMRYTSELARRRDRRAGYRSN